MVASNAAARGVPKGLVLDEGRREVRLDGGVVDLTASEFALLAALISKPGVAVSSHDLLSAMWDIEWRIDVSTLHVHISRLRSKLGESGKAPRYIRSVRGFGYRFEPEAPTSSVVLEFDADLVLRSVAPPDPFLGWDPQAIVGTQFSPAGVSADLAREVVRARVAAGSLSSVIRVDVLAADGTRVPTRVTTQIAVDDEGRFAGITGMFAFD